MPPKISRLSKQRDQVHPIKGGSVQDDQEKSERGTRTRAAVDVSKSIHMKYIKIIAFVMFQNYLKYFYIYIKIIVDILIYFDILILTTTNIYFLSKKGIKQYEKI